jgi:hypothetical protein
MYKQICRIHLYHIYITIIRPAIRSESVGHALNSYVHIYAFKSRLYTQYK